MLGSQSLPMFDRTRETSATTGAGTLTLAGAVTGYQAFSAVVPTGMLVPYASTDGTNWEVGWGTYTLSGTTLARTLLIASSTGSLISWASTVQVWIDLPAVVAANPGLLGGMLSSAYPIVAPQIPFNRGNGFLTPISNDITIASAPFAAACDPTGRFVFVASSAGNGVFPFAINQSTGALSQVSALIGAGTTPQCLAVEPRGLYLYVPGTGGSLMYMFSINQTTGALTALSTPTIALTTPSYGVCCDPTGRFVYTSSNSQVSLFTIAQATGILTAGSTYSVGSALRGITCDPTGRFLYVIDGVSSGNVYQYMINQTTGALTAMGTASITAGNTPWALCCDPSGRFLYVTTDGSNVVEIYSINQQTGQLTNIGTVTENSETYFFGIACDPMGRFLYVSSYGSNNILTYSINQQTGLLTLIATSATTGTGDSLISLDPTGRYLYTANQGGTVSQYSTGNYTSPTFQQDMNASMSLNIAGSYTTFSFASVGSGGLFTFSSASGGVLTSNPSISFGGYGWQVGDLCTVGGGNNDAVILVTSVASGAITVAVLLYGGSGYYQSSYTNAPVYPQRSWAFRYTLTGALTASNTIILSPGALLTRSDYFSFVNNTTGAYTVTVKIGTSSGTSTGTGVVVQQGISSRTPALIATDGVTDVWFADAHPGGIPMFVPSTLDSTSIFMGSGAGAKATTIAGSVAIGYQALKSATVTTGTVAIGYMALQAQTSPASDSNTAIGYQSLYAVTTGTQNCAVGWNSGNNTTAFSGSQGTFIGCNAGVGASSGAATNCTAIGYGALVNASNAIQFGNSSVTQNIFASGSYLSLTGVSSTTTGTIQVNGANGLQLYCSAGSSYQLALIGTGAITIMTGALTTGALTWSTAQAFSPTANSGFSVNTTGTGTIALSSGTLGSIDKMTIGSTTRAAGNFSFVGAGAASTTSSYVLAAAGTASVAPLTITGGTNLTTAAAGAVENDSICMYGTTNTTDGRAIIPLIQQFRLTANGSALTTISNFFGTTSNISLVASAYYEIDIECYFTKSSTADALTWTFTNSAAPTSMNIHTEWSPLTGVNTTTGASNLCADIVNSTTAAQTMVTGTLTASVNHYARFRIFLKNGTGTSLLIQVTNATGVTPLLGSRWTSRRIPTGNTGTFHA